MPHFRDLLAAAAQRHERVALLRQGQVGNSKPKPFKWTAKADTILAKNARARAACSPQSRVSNE
jgi:hypothetical protein